MAAPDVDLIEVGHSPVACGHGDVFELDVHIVLGYIKGRRRISFAEYERDVNTRHGAKPSAKQEGLVRTFKQLPTVDLARSDLEGDNMPLQEPKMSVYKRTSSIDYSRGCCDKNANLSFV